METASSAPEQRNTKGCLQVSSLHGAASFVRYIQNMGLSPLCEAQLIGAGPGAGAAPSSVRVAATPLGRLHRHSFSQRPFEAALEPGRGTGYFLKSRKGLSYVRGTSSR